MFLGNVLKFLGKDNSALSDEERELIWRNQFFLMSFFIRAGHCVFKMFMAARMARFLRTGEPSFRESAQVVAHAF